MKIKNNIITLALALVITLSGIMGTLVYAYKYTKSNSSSSSSSEFGNGKMQQYNWDKKGGTRPQGNFNNKSGPKPQGNPPIGDSKN